jgi:hypothetical protein
LYLLHVHDGKTYHGAAAACESQNAFSEVAVDKQKHSPAAACGGAQSSRSLSPSSSGKNNTTGTAVALKNTSRERNSLSCVVAQLLFALRKPSTKIVSNFLCLCKSFGLSLLALKHTHTLARKQRHCGKLTDLAGLI